MYVAPHLMATWPPWALVVQEPTLLIEPLSVAKVMFPSGGDEGPPPPVSVTVAVQEEVAPTAMVAGAQATAKAVLRGDDAVGGAAMVAGGAGIVVGAGASVGPGVMLIVVGVVGLVGPGVLVGADVGVAAGGSVGGPLVGTAVAACVGLAAAVAAGVLVTVAEMSCCAWLP